ncbi:MAG: SbcC/MukB-like Walker B domain-containing protein, partial [Bacillota bacterium]|nr:SbcC/MukB-like Walker B domain-containing protein [Bacillota bacterium]
FTDTAAWSVRQIREQQQAAEAELQTCEMQLQELRQGIKQYPNPGIKRLQALIGQELFARHGRQIPVWIIADELEIIEPRWTDALEGYLHTQKFYLLVEPDWFEEALAIYDTAKRQQNFYDIGLIDIERLAADKPVSRLGSLAEKLRTDNALVRLFIDYVLGDVICCDQTADLRKYRRAITDSCMLYQNYVARQLNPNCYKDRYIGKSAILAQIAALEEKARQLARFIAECDKTAPRYDAWASLESFSEYETGSLATTIGRLAEKEELSARLNTLNSELAGLDLAWLDRLIEKIGRVRKSMADLEQQSKAVTAQRYQLEAQIGLVRDRELPELSQQVEAIRTDIRQHYYGDWLQREAEPRFVAEYKQRDTGLAVRNAFYSPQNRSESQRKQKWERVQTSRSDFNRLYQASVSVTAESNRDFEQRLERLEQEKLPDYLEQIHQAQKMAYEQFQSDFLGKLKESIDAVTDSIRELNRTLKDRSWGNERFQFVVEPHPNYRRFYDMIMDDLLMQGYSITYAAFREKHGATVDELFRQILAVDEETSGDQRSELERNIESYCNYRTYLRFDLHTIDENNEVQRLSRTLRKKSGGETQTPYYIAMLAAFVQLYRIGDRNRSCMQLIIFDEAFSKMDGERIRESIRLLRRIGFQCLISAPPDKIADIAPLVDRNICVLKDQHRSFLAYFDKSDIDRIEGELEVEREIRLDEPDENDNGDAKA